MQLMPSLGAKLLVAFDASSVSGALASWGLRGLRLRSAARVPLAAGVLVPSPLEDNLVRVDEVRDALTSVRASLKTNGRRAALILPDGLARAQLLEVPRGVPFLEYARYRMSQGLPYPASEAVIDALDLGGRRFLCAAVRRAVIEPYEAVAASAGFSQDRVELAPLAAVAGLRRLMHGGDSTVDVILGDAAISLTACQGRELRVFRSRRRDRGSDEARWLHEEVDRTSALSGGSVPSRVRVVGSGAAGVVRGLEALGLKVEPGWPVSDGAELPVQAVELAWLGAALE